MNTPSGVTAALLLPFVLLAGLAIGLMVRPSVDHLLGLTIADDHDDHDPHAGHNHADEEEDHDEDHLDLSFEAVQNLNLLIRPAELSDFTQVRRMPGEILESPGLSSRKIAAPVSGRIAKLFAAPGMSVEPGGPLVEIEIIDDQLMQAQLKLLELLTEQEIAAAELKRLTPLADSGGVVGRKKLETEYRLKEVEASLSRTRQELAMRGLSQSQIDSVERSRTTITRLVASVPSVDAATTAGDAPSTSERDEIVESLAMEDLLVEVGQNVARGDAVATLAVHNLLLVCGHAFESEVDLVTQIAADKQPIAMELGDSEQAEALTGFTIQHVAGHVDERSQTYHFFVPLSNQVVSESTNSLGNTFRTWKYKVGQRVHILAPAEQFEQQIVLPREAVVEEGADFFVFREIDPMQSHPHGDVYSQMEPVAVNVVARDRTRVAIAPGGQLKVGERVAINAAYKMHLALESQRDGGGGGHHGHDH